MRELIQDPFYARIEKYNRCILDYCLIQDETPHQGYRSHKAAVLFAMGKVSERYIEAELKAQLEFGEPQEEPLPWSMDVEKAKAVQIAAAAFLQIPKISSKKSASSEGYGCEGTAALGAKHIPYWYAFWNTPHGTGYGPQDFGRVNEVLFPKGTEELEVYAWTTDWSNYFDDGHEWWGTGCWSVYDRQMGRYVVILASTTD